MDCCIEGLMTPSTGGGRHSSVAQTDTATAARLSLNSATVALFCDSVDRALRYRR